MRFAFQFPSTKARFVQQVDYFHCRYCCIVVCCLLLAVNDKAIQPRQRLRRMRRTFARDGGILLEDYEYFRRLAQGDAATLLSIDFRKLAQLRAQQAPRPN